MHSPSHCQNMSCRLGIKVLSSCFTVNTCGHRTHLNTILKWKSKQELKVVLRRKECLDAAVCIMYVPRRCRVHNVRASTPPCASCTCLDAAVCIMYMPRRGRVHHVRASTPPCASCTCLDAVVRVADARATDMTIEEKLVTEVSDWDRLTRNVARWRRILQPKTGLQQSRKELPWSTAATTRLD